ncbi:MAG: hypothetical protein A2734_01200 [Parcubacteria group bacterium RIFCSPHIGHO2_01_FULL_40_30]|nr:MAG: hypothetical protein A2734_01200 [Parcubacteria group bacterium RIFCSPHIGHO2_01_FULL_40_30]OHB19634.1 MAG: hypothetical protein A3D40_02045 [Parcubacteria group bacterium RIFCSPHIGHO2_02_FULL_40_12]OHB23082.1 MAG: hypothetical protein A3I22_00015 [Parcubacteria group bacterium RIFCSPLOWO2_02_FULL_40_12]OHB24252.1 MAG: hypothetical protein A3F96_00040 [Parcubacteria group bacterium RIFCSPLOWO2_12_FULL_40_10]
MEFTKLIQDIFNWALALVGIAVFINFLWAGLLWFTAAGRPGPIGQAKEKMTNSLIGAIILLASYLILNTINPDLVKNSFDLPGLGTNTGNTVNINPGGPIPAASLLADLQTERSKYGPTISHTEAGIILNATAWKNRADGWRLLKKQGGVENNCPQPNTGQPISCDWLVHQPSGLGLDVFTDGPGLASNGQRINGAAAPRWGNGYPETNWVAPVQP